MSTVLRPGWHVENAGPGWEECYLAPNLFVRDERGKSPSVYWSVVYDSNEMAFGYEATIESAMITAEQALARIHEELKAGVESFAAAKGEKP